MSRVIDDSGMLTQLQRIDSAVTDGTNNTI